MTLIKFMTFREESRLWTRSNLGLSLVARPSGAPQVSTLSDVLTTSCFTVVIRPVICTIQQVAPVRLGGQIRSHSCSEYHVESLVSGSTVDTY